MKYTAIVVLLLVSVLTRCYAHRDTGSTATLLRETYDSIHIDTLRYQWRADQNGCKHIRTHGMFESIVSRLRLDTATVEHVIAALGNPDRTFYKTNDEPSDRWPKEIGYLEYFIESSCKHDFPASEVECQLKGRFMIDMTTMKVIGGF